MKNFKESVVVGFDIGTSSLKITIVGLSNSRIIENIKTDYKGKEVAPGIVPVSIYETALADAVNNLTQDYNIEAIGLASQMYSLCEETDSGILVHQWNSLWAKDEELEGNLKKYMTVSGCPVDTIYPAYKLFTNKDKSKKFLAYGLKEHLVYFLTKNLVTDFSCASASGLMDIHQVTWNKELLKAIDWSVEKMPEIKRHNTIAGYLNVPCMNLTNDRIPVVPGLGDGISASYACKNVSKVCANLGTSMAARAFASKENLRYTDRTWTYLLDESTCIVGGISSNGCSVLNWAEELGMNKECDSKKSNNNVMFFPWLHGERTPYWSSDLKGTFTGIEIDTDIQMISTAIIKGVGFTIANIINLVSQDVEASDMVVVAGGGVYKKELMNVLKGSVDIKICTVYDSDYLASYGAAISAAEAIGIDIKKNIEVKEIITPDFKFKDEYRKWLDMCDKLAKLYQ